MASNGEQQQFSMKCGLSVAVSGGKWRFNLINEKGKRILMQQMEELDGGITGEVEQRFVVGVLMLW